MGSQEQGVVVLALGQVKELLRYSLRCLVFRPCEMEHTQRIQHRKPLQGLPRLLTQRRSPREDGCHLGCRVALGGFQHQDKGRQEVQLVLVARERLGHGSEHLQPCGKVRVCLDIGRALQRLCPGTQEVDHCLLRVATLAVVMRQHFGLRLDQPGKLSLQYLRNALVDLSSGAGEQRLVRGLAGEGMLEGVGGRGEPARLVEEFHDPEVLQIVVEGFVGQTGHRLEQRY